MNPGEIYAKTDEGVRELRERKLNLPIALRSLLIMIDGNRTVGEVMERARALRADASALAARGRPARLARFPARFRTGVDQAHRHGRRRRDRGPAGTPDRPRQPGNLAHTVAPADAARCRTSVRKAMNVSVDATAITVAIGR